jgi:hypothetical protein
MTHDASQLALDQLGAQIDFGIRAGGEAMSDDLLKKIKIAVKEYDEAERSFKKLEEAAGEARKEQQARGYALGKLLLEAKERFPKSKDFIAFVEDQVGLKRSRAYEIISCVGGAPEFELKKVFAENQARQKEATRKRVARHRTRKRTARKPAPSPPSSPPSSPPASTGSAPEASLSVTPTNVTDLAAAKSAQMLAEFRAACDEYLKPMTPADRRAAIEYAQRYLLAETERSSEAALAG